MKIQIISDLHQEFGSTDLSFDNADVVVLAGVNLQLFLRQNLYTLYATFLD